MILNAYAVLALLTNLIRLPAALLVVVLSGAALCSYRSDLSPDGRKSIEDRSYLLVMLVVLLMGLNVLSWPLFYLLLQSYVPQWQGVMCIYGVTKIGTGSLGVARFLPGLLLAIQLLKPLLLFLCGASFVAYWINRQTRAAALLRRVLASMLLVGAVSLIDSALESAYVAVPKRENIPDVGCCTAAGAALHRRLIGASFVSDEHRGWLAAAYFGVHGLLIVGLAGRFTFWPRRSRPAGSNGLFIGALMAMPISFLFLIEIAAPTILHLPLHHCAYDLLARAPETVVGIGLFALGTFGAGWSWLATWFTKNPESAIASRQLADRTAFVALFGYASSLVLMSTELVLNWYG